MGFSLNKHGLLSHRLVFVVFTNQMKDYFQYAKCDTHYYTITKNTKKHTRLYTVLVH